MNDAAMAAVGPLLLPVTGRAATGGEVESGLDGVGAEPLAAVVGLAEDVVVEVGAAVSEGAEDGEDGVVVMVEVDDGWLVAVAPVVDVEGIVEGGADVEVDGTLLALVVGETHGPAEAENVGQSLATMTPCWAMLPGSVTVNPPVNVCGLPPFTDQVPVP